VNTGDEKQPGNFVYMEATRLAGRWPAGPLWGSYRFTASLSDNYLELCTASGEFEISAEGGLVHVSDDLSLQTFCDRTGLGALELLADRELMLTP